MGIWDESYHFLARPNQGYIHSNLLVDTPMRDFELNVLSYMDLQGSEIWTRTLLPEAPDTDTTLLPFFLDDLKLQLLRESRQGDPQSERGERLVMGAAHLLAAAGDQYPRRCQTQWLSAGNPLAG